MDVNSAVMIAAVHHFTYLPLAEYNIDVHSALRNGLIAFEVAIPITLLLAFFPTARNKVEWGCRLALMVGYSAFLLVIVPACLCGFWWHMAIGCVLTVGAIAGYRRIRPDAAGRWRVVFCSVFLLLGLALAGMAGWAIAAGYRCPPDAIELSSPFREGTWCVFSGGGSLLTNFHNVPNQFYGLDIVRVNSAGRLVNSVLPFSDKLQDYPGFGTPLYSPCDGVVLRAIDGNDDMPPGQLPARNTAGNLILLRCGGCKILMGHMTKGSLHVHEGDAVSRGQLLGQLGKSGWSQFPHLHISFAVGGTGKGTYDGRGLAARFDGRFLVRNSTISAGAKN